MIRPNYPSLMVGFLDGTQCLHKAYVSHCWTAKTDISMSRNPWNIACEFAFISSAVPIMSYSSYLNGLWDGK